MKKILLILAILTMCGCSAYEVKSGERVPAPYGEQFSYIPAEVVKGAVREAHKLFTYESDTNGEWTSYGLELTAGLPFKGDCEDFALTVAEYLEMQGYEPRHMALALLNVGYLTGKIYNHAALIVKTNEGQLVVDNNSKRAVSVNFYDSSSWYSMRRLDTQQWRRVEIAAKAVEK